ncbi:MAG: ATP-binding protein, partial [Alphaproteobacteria bacterium]
TAHDKVVLDEQQVVEGEEEWLHEDGLRTYLTVKFPIFDFVGNISGIGAIGTDITDRKRAEELLQKSEKNLQLRITEFEEAQRRLENQEINLIRLAGDLKIARDQAEAANRAKTEFLAAMSHELRTPLNAIIGFSEIIQTEILGPVGSVKYRGYASDIHDSGIHLLDLINDILDLSKVESGMDELYEENIEIPKLTRSVWQLVQQRAEKRDVRLILELPEALPALRADLRKLKQILVNLMSNAIKFTEAGGEVTLKVTCDEENAYVFQVIDTGIGIAREDVSKALSQFGQIDSTLSRQHEGTGLGLPLTKALVELHDGSLDLQSQPSVGTTVTVRFPAERIVHHQSDRKTVAIVGKKSI